MDQTNWLAFLLTQIWSLPYFLIYVIGVVVALVRWWRHPAVSLLCVIGFAMLLVSQLVASGMHLWIMQTHENGMPSEQVSWVLGMSNVFHVIVRLAAWALLLVAMFGWRSVPDQKKSF